MVRVHHVKFQNHVVILKALFFDSFWTNEFDYTFRISNSGHLSIVFTWNSYCNMNTSKIQADVGNILSAEGLSIKWRWLIKFLFRVINSGTFYTFWLWSIMMDPNWRILPKSYHFPPHSKLQHEKVRNQAFVSAIKLSNFNG